MDGLQYGDYRVLIATLRRRILFHPGADGLRLAVELHQLIDRVEAGSQGNEALLGMVDVARSFVILRRPLDALARLDFALLAAQQAGRRRLWGHHGRRGAQKGQ